MVHLYWYNMTMQKTTLLFLLRDNRILLAMKKRGTGQGKWNGVGGKVLAHETIEAATIRECQEEIVVRPLQLQKVAEIDFVIPSRDFHNYTYIYTTTKWKGEPQETEEMAPAWFTLETIPYDQMWADDRFWLPYLLAGRKLRASFVFDDQEQIVKKEIKLLEN